VLSQIQGLLGQQGSDLIRTMIQTTSKPSTSILASIIGIVTLLLGASGVFGQLQDSLNSVVCRQAKRLRLSRARLGRARPARDSRPGGRVLNGRLSAAAPLPVSNQQAPAGRAVNAGV
jgi:hypothetical protein